MVLLTNFVYGAYISLRFGLQSVNLLDGEKMHNPKYLCLNSNGGNDFFLCGVLSARIQQRIGA